MTGRFTYRCADRLSPSDVGHEKNDEKNSDDRDDQHAEKDPHLENPRTVKERPIDPSYLDRFHMILCVIICIDDAQFDVICRLGNMVFNGIDHLALDERRSFAPVGFQGEND